MRRRWISKQKWKGRSWNERTRALVVEVAWEENMEVKGRGVADKNNRGGLKKKRGNLEIDTR